MHWLDRRFFNKGVSHVTHSTIAHVFHPWIPHVPDTSLLRHYMLMITPLHTPRLFSPHGLVQWNLAYAKKRSIHNKTLSGGNGFILPVRAYYIWALNKMSFYVYGQWMLEEYAIMLREGEVQWGLFMMWSLCCVGFHVECHARQKQRYLAQNLMLLAQT